MSKNAEQKDTTNSAAETQGTNVKVVVNERTVVVITGGFSRQISLSPEQSAQLIEDPAILGLFSGEKNDPILSIIEPNGAIYIAEIISFEEQGEITEDFFKARDISDPVLDETQIHLIEEQAIAQLVDVDVVSKINLSNIVVPRGLDVDGQYLTSKDASGKVHWFYPKAVKLRRKPLREVLRKEDSESNYDLICDKLKEVDCLVKSEKTELAPDRSLNENQVVNSFFDFVREKKPWLTAKELEKTVKDLLISIGLQKLGNPAIDQVIQSFLLDTRSAIRSLDETKLLQKFQKNYPTNVGYYKPLMTADGRTIQEALAWDDAVVAAEEFLISLAMTNLTTEELEEQFETIGNPKEKFEIKSKEKSTDVVDERGERIPASQIFNTRENSPLSIEDWCQLPIRPVVLPPGKPERGVDGLATFIFDKIIYSKEVCDRRGTQVGLSPAKRAEYIESIVYAIEKGIPLVATEYLPLIAVANPIKRNTQLPGLAEIDLVRRRLEIIKAVEMFYEPGMVWMLGNEAPAFQGPMFNLDQSYVESFQDEMGRIMTLLDPEAKRLKLFNMSNLLWGDELKKQQWEQYKQPRLKQVTEAFFDHDHPEHAEIVEYINKFIYPMSTCINPYKLPEAQGLSMEEVLAVYSVLRQITRTDFRGVDASAQTDTVVNLSPQQKKLLEHLHNWGRDITFKYRTAMDSRDVLPAFSEFIPHHALAHTIITKREKLVLYPNSGKGETFPAHGEAVLQPSSSSWQRTRVTVHPWRQIISQPERYKPMYVANREEPLYFVEAS